MQTEFCGAANCYSQPLDILNPHIKCGYLKTSIWLIHPALCQPSSSPPPVFASGPLSKRKRINYLSACQLLAPFHCGSQWGSGGPSPYGSGYVTPILEISYVLLHFKATYCADIIALIAEQFELRCRYTQLVWWCVRHYTS